MDLFRLHAYAVSPQRGEEEFPDPAGGAVDINADLRNVIDANLASARFDKRTTVDFNVDTTTRTNDVRDLLLNYVFGEPATAKAAGVSLARRLCSAMDHRSTECLFIPAAFRAGPDHVATLWTFPRDEALRFRQRRSGPAIQVLTDIFSQSSKLRKAAHFRGRKLKNHFLGGRVLDFQADHGVREVADFWIQRFLQCKFGMTGEAGTRLLARIARNAFDSCETTEDQEQLYAGLLSIRRSPNKRLSLQDFADRYLSGGARKGFLAAVPNKESLNALFDFQTNIFDTLLQFRVFQLETGVFVSSPIRQIGQSVIIEEGKLSENGALARTLSCEGQIVDERLRKRHA